MKYFSKFPYVTYSFDDNDSAFYVRNIFIRLKFLDFLKENENLFEYYSMGVAERPDVVAHRVYGNSNLHWVVMLANDIVDPKEWLMDNQTLDAYVKSRYDNPLATAYTVRNGEVADVRAAQKALTDNPFGTVDSAPNQESFNVTDPNQYFPVSYYAMEEEKNDAKRIIRIIKPSHINDFLSEFERKIR